MADLGNIVQKLNESNWKEVQEIKGISNIMYFIDCNTSLAALEKQLEEAYQMLQEKESEVERLKSTLKKNQGNWI